MEIDRLRSFVQLAKRLHFGQTAEFLHLSQPALSKQIRHLESELGVALFNRDRHGVSLTEAGKLFLLEAKELVKRFDEVYEHGRRIARGATGTLSVGFGFSTVTLVPRIVSRFRRLHPHVEIKLQDLPSLKQLSALESETMNVGFVRLPVNPKFESRIVLIDRLVLALPESDERLNKKINLRDFKEQGFIAHVRSRSETLYDHMLEVCAAYGFRPKIVQEAYEFPTILALVAAGLGVALVPESQFRVKVEGVSYRQLDNSVSTWKVGAVYRKGDGQPLTHAFLKVLAEEIT